MNTEMQSPKNAGCTGAIKQMYRYFDLCKRRDLLRRSRILSSRFETLTATQINNLVIIRVFLPCNLSQIMDITGLSPAGASYFVERLVKEKIVRRLTDPRDRRQILIHPTRKMTEVFDAMDSELDSFIEERMSNFSPEESAVVEKGVHLICKELENYFREQNRNSPKKQEI